MGIEYDEWKEDTKVYANSFVNVQLIVTFIVAMFIVILVRNYDNISERYELGEGGFAVLFAVATVVFYAVVLLVANRIDNVVFIKKYGGIPSEVEPKNGVCPTSYVLIHDGEKDTCIGYIYEV